MVARSAGGHAWLKEYAEGFAQQLYTASLCRTYRRGKAKNALYGMHDMKRIRAKDGSFWYMHVERV